MATGEAIGCFGLTESDHGSDPANMGTRARRDGGSDTADWVLNGSKMWITNGSVADVAVIWAQTDDGIRGFVVPTDAPGFSARLIKHKLSLRASVTSELVLDNVRLPHDAVFPEVCGLVGPLSCLNEARYGIVWGAMGAARKSFQTALEYAGQREQFGRPISGLPHSPNHPRCQRDLPGVPRDPAHGQPRVCPDLRRHPRDAHSGDRPGPDRTGSLPLSQAR